MDGFAIYRAKETCHIGGLREKGAVFRYRRLDPCPRYLEEVVGEVPVNETKSKDFVTPGPTSEDIEAVAPQPEAKPPVKRVKK